MSALAARVAEIRDRVAAAITRRGPGPEVTVIAVSKRHPAGAIARAASAGMTDFGENYAQELRDKQRELEGIGVRWHFIGPLQTNKVKYVAACHLIHTVDRPALLTALETRARHLDRTLEVLVQVNVGREPQKSGVDPEQLPGLLEAFAEHPHLRCRGLMAIPPTGPIEVVRGHFRHLRDLADLARRDPRPGVDMSHLSMGMSADFEVAIEEGATLVRIGTAIFGPRTEPPP